MRSLDWGEVVTTIGGLRCRGDGHQAARSGEGQRKCSALPAEMGRFLQQLAGAKDVLAGAYSTLLSTLPRGESPAVWLLEPHTVQGIPILSPELAE